MSPVVTTSWPSEAVLWVLPYILAILCAPHAYVSVRHMRTVQHHLHPSVTSESSVLTHASPANSSLLVPD